MSEFLLELYSEEIPPKLQIDAREKIKFLFEKEFQNNEIQFKSSNSFSTPTRLVILFNGIPDFIEQKAKVIKGPNVNAPQNALEGFIRSNNLKEGDVYKENIEKGTFYFAKQKAKKIEVSKELEHIVPSVLNEYSWKKTMKWSSYEISWGRPLLSILSIFNKKTINFNFFHLKSSNFTYSNDDLSYKAKKVYDFKSYANFLKSLKIVLNQNERKKIIIKKIQNLCKKRNLKDYFSEPLIEEVNNLVERPNFIIGKFDESYLKVPSEILITTMQKHQKYFPLFDNRNNLINSFLVVTNLPDIKGYIKKGNERVIRARLADAKFFWEKNKKQNLVKQAGKLKSLSFFNQLGSMLDKTQRLRKLASLISDNLNLNKEKVEIAASLCKADLISDLVNEYPELQGVMGKYFAESQGFDQEICQAISDHYLPYGIKSPIPKKNISSAVALADKIDTLVGFFGINEKPTSSKDPFALRRSAIGLLRIIFENNIKIKLKDLLNYSVVLYSEQNVKFKNQKIAKDLLIFFSDRAKNLLKDKKIRIDIIEAAISSHASDDYLSLYKKCVAMNKNFSNEIGRNIISTYKRVSNILEQETKNENIVGQPDSILFEKEEEKLFFDKINEIRKHFATIMEQENYNQTLTVLSETKQITDNFFNNVIVNDSNLGLKKNRLELLQFFCKTYNNFMDFSKVEGV